MMLLQLESYSAIGQSGWINQIKIPLFYFRTRIKHVKSLVVERYYCQRYREYTEHRNLEYNVMLKPLLLKGKVQHNTGAPL